ncbi:hypothetical protein COY17_00320 [Candidatus Saccharibacteria bacterium CG_4_10_14_0_2_um_filter_52_9]|nr:MAG: hypothetical protein COY17_00320 [Candidatus Saccharibacteria bacterium CG_4_10_14_0_2_um_filter_52_9]
MKNLVLHDATRRQLDDYLTAPAHALLLVGPMGSGKLQLATRLAEAVLELPAGSFDDNPYITVISVEPDKKLIAIEAVRQLEKFLALKVPGQSGHDRAIIIEDAHLLSHEAQNALLKTLEEPPKGTILILTASHEQALLPTIRSRAQSITVNRPAREALETHFASQHAKEAIAKAYAVSGGLPGLMHGLLSDSEHPLAQATARARQLLSQTTYERLLAVDELSKQRDMAIGTAFILQQMAHVSLQTAQGVTAKKWQAILSAAYQAGEALTNSAQPKLALTQLMLSLQ